MRPNPEQLQEYYDKLERDYNQFVLGSSMGAAVPYGTKGVAGPTEPYYPVRHTVANNYAGMSVATPTDNRPAADTTAGNVVADAGFAQM